MESKQRSVCEVEEESQVRKLLLVFVLLFLCSCGNNPMECYNNVMTEFEGCELRYFESDYRFLIKTVDGEIIYVETLNAFNNEISKKEVMFKCAQ